MPLDRKFESNKIWTAVNGFRASNDTYSLLAQVCEFVLKRKNIYYNKQEMEFMIKSRDSRLNDGMKILFGDNAKINKLDDFLINTVNYLSAPTKVDLGSSSESLNKLVISLLDIESGDCVCDFGCGRGNFLANVAMYAKRNNMHLKEFSGLDIRSDDLLLTKYILKALDVNSITLDQNDIFNSHNLHFWNKTLVFPPFALYKYYDKKIRSLVFDDFVFKPSASNEWIFVDRALSKRNPLEKQNRTVAVLYTKPLMSAADKEYRDNLLRSELIEAIIELPIGSLNFCAVKPVILVLSHNNKKVKLLDASSVLKKDASLNFKSLELPYKDIVKMLEKAPTKLSSDLLKCETLIPSKIFLSDDVKKIKGDTLEQLIETVITGSQYTFKNFKDILTDKKTGYRILTSGDIIEGAVDWNKLQAINYRDNKLDKFAVKKNDVVITSKSSTVKTVVVDIAPKEKIIVTGGMLIVRPNLNKLNPYYLKMFLDSELGSRSLKNIQKGTYIITINAKDILRIVIPKTSIDVQNKKAEIYLSKLNTYLVLKEKVEKLKDNLKNFYFVEDQE